METPTIAQLNDALRKDWIGGSVVMTSGVANHPAKEEIIAAVRAFDDFTEGDDPYGEHDFGALDVAGERVFWKIDYYDPLYQFGSEDPSDPAKTGRLLTILLAEEY